MDLLPEIIGTSSAVLAMKEKVGRLLRSQSESGRLPPVLIEGEMGTGKGLLAAAMHRAASTNSVTLTRPTSGKPMPADNAAPDR